MKVLKICFVFDTEHWDELREVFSEQEINLALHVGGMSEIARLHGELKDAEVEEIQEEKND